MNNIWIQKKYTDNVKNNSRSLIKKFNKQAKNGLIFKIQVSKYIKIIFQGVNFINEYPNLVISKSGKSHNKIVKNEVEILSVCIVKFAVENVVGCKKWNKL